MPTQHNNNLFKANYGGKSEHLANFDSLYIEIFCKKMFILEMVKYCLNGIKLVVRLYMIKHWPTGPNI